MREKAPLATLTPHSAVVIGCYGPKSCGRESSVLCCAQKLPGPPYAGSVVPSRTNRWTQGKRSETLTNHQMPVPFETHLFCQSWGLDGTGQGWDWSV